jgi:hypothetical protein
VSVVLGGLAAQLDVRALGVSAAITRTVVLAVSWWALRGRSRVPGAQFQVWSNLSLAVLVVAVCAAVDLASVLLEFGTLGAQVFVTIVGFSSYLLV